MKSKLGPITMWYFPRYRPNYVRVVVADDRTTLLNDYYYWVFVVFDGIYYLTLFIL